MKRPHATCAYSARLGGAAALALILLTGCASTGATKAVDAKNDAQVAALPSSQQPMLRLARAAHAAGDYASAINLYRTIVAGGSDPAMAVELGDTLMDAGSFDDAIGTYKSVSAKSPAELGAALGLERAYLALNDLPKAMEQAERARALAPQDRKVLIDRGIVLDLYGRHKEAQDSYSAWLAKSPQDRTARVDLALSLAFSGDYDRALDTLSPIARSSNATPRERQDLALIYGLKGDKEEARRWSKLDLDVNETASNLQFYDVIRNAGH